MSEIWTIPGRQRPRFWARQLRGLLLLVVFAVGLAATGLLTWLGSYRGQAGAGALANLQGAGGGHRWACPAGVSRADPATDPDPAAACRCGGRWGGVAGLAGCGWVSGRPLSA